MTVNDPSEPTTIHENNTTSTKTPSSISPLFVPPVHDPSLPPLIRRLRSEDPESDNEHYDAASASHSSNSSGDTFSNRDTLSDTDTADTIIEEEKQRTDTIIEEDKQRTGIIHLDAKVIGAYPITLPLQAEDRLSVEILELFESLLPTPESHERRILFVSKMEMILNTEWPGHDIKVHLFGSSVNDLGTSTSDVDICVTTPWNGLKDVNVLAKGLKKHGMKGVFCVPKAKVPIVRLWDPELDLACDINVNNTLALQNTRLIKAYVQIDPRIRPLAMIVKYWARRRVLNDAASGGTLSTYTWTCMILNFLQMRCPPILPSLHSIDHELAPDNVVINGMNSSFFEDVGQLKGYGEANKESLGGLLYAFFRRFAVEFDYSKQVVSIREGKYLTKAEKGWDDISSRMYRVLCVEEPFNTSRNLGNSADDVSVAGVKEEFLRALDIMYRGDSLDDVVEQYTFPRSYSRSMPLNMKRDFYASPPPIPKYLPTVHTPFGASTQTNDFHDAPVPRNSWAQQRSRSVEPSASSSSSSSSSSPSHYNNHMNQNNFNGHRYHYQPHYQQSHHQQPQHHNNVNSATRRIPGHHHQQQNHFPRRPSYNNNNYFRTQHHRYDNPPLQENEKEVSIDSVGEFPFLPSPTKSTKIETQDRRSSVSSAGVLASEKREDVKNEDKQIELGERKKLDSIPEVKATVSGNNSNPKNKKNANALKSNTPSPSVSTPLQDQTSKKKSKKNVNLEEKTQIPGAYFVNKPKHSNRRQDENSMPNVSSSTPASHITAKKNTTLTEQRQQSIPENTSKDAWQTSSLKRKKKKDGATVDQDVTKKEEEPKSSTSSGNDTATSPTSKKKKSRSSSIVVNSHEPSDLLSESTDTVKALSQKSEEAKNRRSSTSFIFPQPIDEEWKIATSGRKKKKNTTDNSMTSSQAN